MSTMDHSHAKTQKAQSFYNHFSLRFYDFLVYGVFNRFIWKTPTQCLIQLYHQNLSNHHLEVGVGTGFLLDKSIFPSLTPMITLMDINLSCLKKTAQRIQRYQPTTIQHNIFYPIEHTETFDSIALNYVLHCLPGSLHEKSIVFKHLKTLLNQQGVLFGSTLLTSGTNKNWLSMLAMKLYNSLGIFNNTQDELTELRETLNKYFHHVQLIPKGSAVLFIASDQPLQTRYFS